MIIETEKAVGRKMKCGHTLVLPVTGDGVGRTKETARDFLERLKQNNCNRCQNPIR